MEFEQFKDFMLQSAAKHDVRIAQIQETLRDVGESLRSITNTVDHLVANQIDLQESMDEQQKLTQESIRKTQEEMLELRRDTRAELSRVVFGHVTDRDAHTRL